MIDGRQSMSDDADRRSKMGKATQLDEQLSSRKLSRAEIRERETAAKSGGRSEATSDGKIVRPGGSSATPDVVVQAPQRTWD